MSKSIISLLLAALVLLNQAHADDPGDVSWFDLITEDEAVAGAFYAGLFGWEVVSDAGDGTMFSYKGTPIAGMSPITDNVQDVDQSQWIPVIVVDDVSRAAQATLAQGGTIEHPVTRESGWLTYAVIKDAEEVVVALVTTERPLGGNNGPGSWVWAELWTNDVAKAADFYAEVIGYEQTFVDRDDGEYPIFKVGDDPKAGIVKIEFEGVKPGWAPYIGITNMQDTLQKTIELGGRIYLMPEEAAEDGRVALLGDPLGTAFFVYELDGEGQ